MIRVEEDPCSWGGGGSEVNLLGDSRAEVLLGAARRPAGSPREAHIPDVFVESGNREHAFLASSVELQEGYKTSEKKRVHGEVPTEAALEGLQSFPCPSEARKQVSCAQEDIGEMEAILDLKRSCKQGQGCVDKYRCGRMPLRTRFLTPSTPPPPTAPHQPLPETRHNLREGGGWNQVRWDQVSDYAEKWKLEIKIRLYFFIYLFVDWEMYPLFIAIIPGWLSHRGAELN